MEPKILKEKIVHATRNTKDSKTNGPDDIPSV